MSRVDGSVFVPDYREVPYWWLDAPRPTFSSQPPKDVDVVVVGSGVTGLNAALELSRGGRDVVVIDAEDAGFGATCRNAGMMGRSLKHSFGDLVKAHGLQTAKAVYDEANASHEAFLSVLRDEGIDCKMRICGRLIMGRSQRQLDGLEKELSLKKEYLGEDFRMLNQSEVMAEIETSVFVGAAYLPDIGMLHPGRYHLGLVASLTSRQVPIFTSTRLLSIDRTSKGFALKTQNGTIQCRDVVVATNGYTLKAPSKWLARRLIPFNGYVIATEELPADVIERVLPGDRSYLDANFDLSYLRRTPDNRRILFGTRTGSRLPSELKTMAQRLHGDLLKILPGLKGYRIGLAWSCKCASTFNFYPHIGVHEGVNYAVGYSFAGILMGTYLGRKLAWRMLGRNDGDTFFSKEPFQSMPFYSGSPWFVPPAMKVMRLKDRWESRA